MFVYSKNHEKGRFNPDRGFNSGSDPGNTYCSHFGFLQWNPFPELLALQLSIAFAVATALVSPVPIYGVPSAVMLHDHICNGAAPLISISNTFC
jgi:hypothetical protein